MEQSVTRVSGKGKIARVLLVALLSLVGLSVIGVGNAYAAGPVVKSLTPASGSADGGATVTIAGSAFTGATAVTFGGVPATSFTVVTGIKITAVVPPAQNNTANVSVVVTVGGVQSTPQAPGDDTFTYTWNNPPTVTGTGLIPATALQSGTTVTVTAAGTWTAGQLVSVAGFSNKVPSAIYPVVTGGTGSFTITNLGSTTGTGTGTVSPTAAGAVGPVAGGSSVVIVGTHLGGASSVNFGSTPSTSVTVNSGTQITATVPPGVSGSVDITVTTPNATSPTSNADSFNYVGPPVVSGLTTTASPAGGPTGGGTQVTLAGSGYNNVTAVTFGTTPATSFLVNGLNSITAVAPAGTGTVDVTVTVGGTTSAISSADHYTYNGTLAVANGNAAYSNSPGTDVPVTGTSQSGTTVTITAAGAWAAGTQIALSGFTNGLNSGNYSILGGGTGSFTITYAPALSGSGTGTVLIPTTVTPAAVYATSQAGSVLTVFTGTSTTPAGTWFQGQQVYLTGFTNGLATGNYTVTSGTTGSFTVTDTGTTTGTGTGSAIPYQAQSFNAATLVTGGGTINPASLTVTAQPSSGTVTAVGSQLLYFPVQPNPTSYTVSGATTWLRTVTTTGIQTATFQICQTAPSASCTSGTMTYSPAGTGFYVGNQLTSPVGPVTVVEDTGSGIVVPATATSGSTFTSVTAPSEADLPATNSGFNVAGIGGYRSITPVPTGLSLVPGTLTVTGGDSFTTGKYTATLCTAAMGFVPGTCTANQTGNFQTTYPYIETSLNVGTQIAGGSQLSLPTISATWQVNATSGSVSSYETEFVVVTNVGTLGSLVLDAYPSDLASFLNQGLSAPAPNYAAPPPRWTVSISQSGPVPTITNVSPNSGTTAGGTPITLTGSNFTGATSVTIGGNAATNVVVNSGTSISATTPAGTAGAADVAVTAGGNTGTDTGGFTYVAPPAITSIAPSTGKTAGGDSVVITGSGFTSVTGATGVTFGGTNAASYTVNSDTQITATTPAHAAGAVNVVVTNPISSATDTNGFTFLAAPTVTSVAPATGTTAGGTSVTITGTNLTGATSVTFGGAAATGVTVVSGTSITATTPAHAAGVVDVVVTTQGGVGTDTGGYTYVAPATITGVAPSSGSTLGGTSITITGTNFTGATAVTVGGTAATGVTVVSSTSITATTPAGTVGPAAVAVTTAAGTVTDAGGFTYVTPPTITSVSPGAGPTAGGTMVTITGTNLTGATAVTFGGVNATSFTVNSATSITATTPATSTSTVNVSVTTPGGTATALNAFQFTNQPTISSISPTSGPQAGGTVVTINGSNLATVVSVAFGGVDASPSIVHVSATQIKATAPLHAPGAVDITVSDGVNTSPTSPADQFTYEAAPTVTSVAPASGPATGGTSVTITGTNFTGATSVTFGGAPATGVTIVSATSITATTPAGTAGAADVVVTTPGGSGTGTGAFTYVAAPTVTSVAPASGPATGGTDVTITGTNFTGATSVTFGGAPATGVTIVSATSITATTPAGTAGAASVAVITSGGTGTKTGGFTYVAAPTVTSVAPASGPTAGGTHVTITGTNFTGASAVTFGGTAATSVTIVSATSITATTPSGVAGAVDVSVTTPGGSATDTGGFTYVGAPTIVSLAPTSGTALGGTSVVITGTNLTGTTAVTFGGASGTGLVNNSSTQVTITTPAGTAGAVNVVLTAPGGQVTDSGGFTYVAVAPAAPTITGTTPGDGQVTVTWVPGSTGGSPIQSYAVTTQPSSAGCTVNAPATSCTVTGLTNGTAYSFVVAATNSVGQGNPSSPTAPVTPGANGAIPGYWMATSGGAVLTNGAAVSYGSPAGLALNAPIVALTPTPDRKGYWMVGADGGIFNYGDAAFYGSAGGEHLNKPIVGMAATSDGKGYWLVASDGGVFSYGDAAYEGSLGATVLNAPIVGMAGNGTNGYWLVAADGGVFAYGSAPFHGSAGNQHLVQPVTGIAATVGGTGYYLVAADGGVFAYNAPFYGSASGVAAGVVMGITAGAGGGYTLATDLGGAYSYGAGYFGNQTNSGVIDPVISISS